MNGWPVWLASASLRDRRGRVRATGTWGPSTMAYVSASLSVLLDGIGDDTREREFRMNVTLCRHRALTPAEHEALPEWWHQAPATDLAGGPIEVLWHSNIPHVPSCDPCENPSKVVTNPRRPDLWLPYDCGSCGPCLARAACHTLAPEQYATSPP